MAFKMKNPSMMKMAKMAGDSRVAMKMKQQDAAMKLKKDPMQMKTDPMKLQTTTEKQRDVQRQGDFARDDVRKKKDERIAKMIREKAKSKKPLPEKALELPKPGSKSPKAMKKGSAMKKDDYKKALKNDPQLEKYIAKRKTLKKGTAAFGNNQYRINTAYYGKDKADKILTNYRKKNNLSAGDEKGTEKTVKLSQQRIDKLGKINNKTGISEIRRTKMEGETNENYDKREARSEKKQTRRNKGNKKQKSQADLTLEKAKLSDLEGKRGGKKGVVLGKLRTKLANKRVKKGEEKLKNA